MKKILFFISLSIFICLNAQNVNYFEPAVNDAKAAALGQSSLLASRSANYLFSNPSKLIEVKGKSLQLSSFIKSGEYEIERDEVDNSTTDYDAKFNFGGISFASNLKEFFGKEIVLGAGYQQYYNYAFEYTKQKDTYDQSGNFNMLVFGGGIKINEKLSLGYSYSNSINSEIDYRIKTPEYNEDNDNKSQVVSRMKTNFDSSFYTVSGTYVFNENFLISGKYRSKMEYNIDQVVESEFSEYNNDFSSRIYVPEEFSFGINYKNSNIFYVAEYKTRNLDQYRYTNGSQLNDKSKSGFAFSTGIEIGTDLKIRGGFYLRSVPLYSEKYNQQLDVIIDSEKPEKEKGFTFGLGRQYNKFNIDFYYDISFVDRTDIVGTEYNYQTDGYEAIKNEYKTSNMKFGVTLGLAL